MAITIKLRRDSAFEWAKTNPILDEGEPGYETDTKKFKIGDGVSRWRLLDYFVTSDTGTSSLEAALNALDAHVNAIAPHPVYDDGPSLLLLYQNAKV